MGILCTTGGIFFKSVLPFTLLKCVASDSSATRVASKQCETETVQQHRRIRLYLNILVVTFKQEVPNIRWNSVIEIWLCKKIF
jgi:hypothetical protein